jgi:ADP-dependent NAD(P)H-hydrate dehydratase
VSAPGVIEVDDALLRAWPLPEAQDDANKEDRGRVLVIAGSREVPGAAVLAAEAALRAGAGKLVVATPASCWAAAAQALPEARVIALPESADGGPALEGLGLLHALARHTAAVLVGPGMMDAPRATAFVRELLPLFAASRIVLDAAAMDAAPEPAAFEVPMLLTPHAGEMAHLSGLAREEVEARSLDIAREHARRWGSVVALKGATTFVADAQGRAWRHQGGTSGLATSGSGDVLAGIVVGLAARGAPLEQAAVWGVALHARAGERLAREVGPLGFLARELAAQVPRLMHEIAVPGE